MDQLQKEKIIELVHEEKYSANPIVVKLEDKEYHVIVLNKHGEDVTLEKFHEMSKIIGSVNPGEGNTITSKY